MSATPPYGRVCGVRTNAREGAGASTSGMVTTTGEACRAFSGGTIMDFGLQQTLQHAVEHGIEAYITSRRARIPGFIERHFSFCGALALHRETFGRDFYKHPVNLLWGLPVT